MSKRVDNVHDDGEKQESNDEFMSYPLNEPITAYGEKISVIKMRKPGGQDLLMIGNPVIFSPHCEPPRVEHDFQKVVAMVARLSEPSIPSTSLSKLSPNDLVGIAWFISPFFTPAR